MPTLLVVMGYGLAFYFFALTLRTIPVGVAYAIRAGSGVVCIALVSRVVLGQKLDAPAMMGMGLMVAGMIIVNVFSRALVHQES